ncbi:hypothetical protein FOMPIDRAFT_62972 [Fomitopsis schrenkii]|uniref:USP domain-containing protein n=1 Tax=Fomitopsis schrenkii TaxID=2126942 RepID=S8DNV6_FOMSC|nr:hypothetical protein FOMPIDRAFT_62972 [Fomitopsis schrenkii]
MRQLGISDEDIQFRTALQNMRYKLCTERDLQLLESRIIGSSPSAPSLSDANFRDISVITSFNVDRDAMNTEGAARFAQEHRTELHYFYSVDRWPKTSEDSASLRQQQRFAKNDIRSTHGTTAIPAVIQNQLWCLPPHCTENHAGILPLCIGMPVLLKNNEATELCATNGAEGTVVGWSAVSIREHDVLDTLFVKLKSPARDIHILNLPLNVIPLTRKTVRVMWSVGTDGSSIRWDREQISVLLNFAMTDFGSQGRTRPYNPCHLTNCRTHQSMYTCLSRSSSLKGTLLLGYFDRNKITGGNIGTLRNEFRELDMLDRLTTLKMKGLLPDTVSGDNRSVLLQRWKSYEKSCATTTEQNEPMLTPAKRQRPESVLSSTTFPTKKRIALRDEALPQAVIRQPTVPFIPTGPRWDSENWSCAYDAVLCILINTLQFRSQQQADLSRFDTHTGVMRFIINALNYNLDAARWIDVRDSVRQTLRSINREWFPMGHSLTSVSNVLEYLLPEKSSVGMIKSVCTFCSYETTSQPFYELNMCVTTSLLNSCPTANVTASDVLNAFLDQSRREGSCALCNSPLTRIRSLSTQPLFVAMEFQPRNSTSSTMTITRSMQWTRDGGRMIWDLCGLVYLGGGHFVSRFVDINGTAWYHDGAVTLNACLREAQGIDLAAAMGRRMTHAIYVMRSTAPVTVA